MNDFVISCVYEYLERIITAEEIQLEKLRERGLTSLDTVDIIDLVETRARYETLCQVQHDITEVFKWGRRLSGNS